jgi:hypothetical protein
MRVLSLDLGVPAGEIDLHPFVTVLSGLDGAARQRLVHAVRAVVAGEDPGVPGLVQSQGLLIELSAGGPVAARAPAPVTDLVVDLDRALAGSAHTTGLRAQVEQAERAAAVAAVRVEEARADLDLSAAAELHRLRGARRSTGPAEPVATPAVHEAFAAWRAAPVTVSVPAQWAVELLGRWEACRRRGQQHAERRRELDRRVEVAERAVAVAAGELERAQAEALPLLLDPDEELRLAELAVGSVEKRGLRTKVRRRTDDEQAELDALLDKVGQPTYSAYMVHRLAPVPRPGAVEAVAEARTALARAEAERDEALAASAADPELEALQLRVAALSDEVRRRLGVIDLPDDLGPVLASCTEALPNPERSLARDRLLDELTAAGYAVEPGEDDEALAQRVGAWLATAPATTVDPAAAACRAAEEELEARLARHRRALQLLDGLEAQAAEHRRHVTELRERLVEPESGIEAPQRILREVRARIEALGPVAEDDGTPLVLTGSLADLGPGDVGRLLDGLEPLTHRVQVVLLTDHPEAGRWADDVGLARALRSGTAIV